MVLIDLCSFFLLDGGDKSGYLPVVLSWEVRSNREWKMEGKISCAILFGQKLAECLLQFFENNGAGYVPEEDLEHTGEIIL